jgi:hypothetical protein
MNLEAICDSWDDPQVTESEFKRYWLNQPVPTTIQEGLFPGATWGGSLALDSGIEGAVAFAVEVAEDRTWACIGAAGTTKNDENHVEVIDYRPGTGWLVGRMVELTLRHPTAVVIVQSNAPAGSLVSDLTEADVPVVKATTQEYAQACGMFYDAVAQDVVRHLGQRELNVAVGGAVKRTSGDAFVWDRRKSSLDISPLVAVTLALWGHKVHGGIDITESVW